MKKRRSAKQWYKDYEPWIWRSGLMALGAANMWLTLNFVSVKDDKEFKKLYWENFKTENCRISQNEKDIEILKERTHR